MDILKSLPILHAFMAIRSAKIFKFSLTLDFGNWKSLDPTIILAGECESLTHISSNLDVNECLIKAHRCHQNASCINTIGNYSCLCDGRFNGDGFLCIGMVFIFDRFYYPPFFYLNVSQAIKWLGTNLFLIFDCYEGIMGYALIIVVFKSLISFNW